MSNPEARLEYNQYAKGYRAAHREKVKRLQEVWRVREKERLVRYLLQNPKQCECGCRHWLIDTEHVRKGHSKRRIVSERRCEKCGSMKTNMTKDGYEKWCRSKQTGGWLCVKCYYREYYLTQPQFAEHKKDRSRQRHKDNPEYDKVTQRRWHPERVRFLNKRWQEANVEYLRQYQNEYYRRVVKPKKAKRLQEDPEYRLKYNQAAGGAKVKC
ncbi:MAG: hypothetical protein WBZ36_11680 [Candidatus Nitrosopolaris sp.]